METVRMMNPTIWLFAAILIVWVIVQAYLFVKLALNFNKRNALMTKAELKNCVKVGSTAVIGPALNAVAVCFAMIGMVGAADTFMRVGVIGAPAQEMFLAQQAVSVAGAEFGAASFTPSVMTFVIWMQVWGTIPFFIHLMISIKPLDRAVESSKARSKKGGPQFINYLGTAAAMAIMPYFMAGYMTNAPQRWAVIASLVVGICLTMVQKKTGNKFLANFSMIICMIVGMIVGELVFGMAG